eukprot:5958918-Prorocentrum_lima.AAC.1
MSAAPIANPCFLSGSCPVPEDVFAVAVRDCETFASMCDRDAHCPNDVSQGLPDNKFGSFVVCKAEG